MPDQFTSWLLILDALAVFRLTWLVVEDRIPFAPLRDRLECDHPDSLLTEWIGCPWCVSVWIAAMVVALHVLLPTVWPYAAAVLAFSAVAGLLATWVQRD